MYRKAAEESNTIVLPEIAGTTFAREVDAMSAMVNKYMTVFMTYRFLMHNVSKLKPFLSSHKRKQVNNLISFYSYLTLINLINIFALKIAISAKNIHSKCSCKDQSPYAQLDHIACFSESLPDCPFLAQL